MQSANENELQQAIDAKPFPKVTKESMEKRIQSVEYFRCGSTVTICSITMVNGFSIRGESACVDPRNFDEHIGKGLAYRDAFDKIWAFEGYLLAERNYIATAQAGFYQQIAEPQ
jgi:hypothetical protein